MYTFTYSYTQRSWAQLNPGRLNVFMQGDGGLSTDAAYTVAVRLE